MASLKVPHLEKCKIRDMVAQQNCPEVYLRFSRFLCLWGMDHNFETSVLGEYLIVLISLTEEVSKNLYK